jgi:hypothetical protein
MVHWLHGFIFIKVNILFFKFIFNRTTYLHNKKISQLDVFKDFVYKNPKGNKGSFTIWLHYKEFAY